MRPEFQIANHIPAPMLTAADVKRILSRNLSLTLGLDIYYHTGLVPVPACECDFHFPSWERFGYPTYACFFDIRSYSNLPVLCFFFPQIFTEYLLHARHFVRCTEYSDEHDSHGSYFHKFIMHLQVKISSNHDTLNNLRMTKNKAVFGETHTPSSIFSLRVGNSNALSSTKL